MRTKGTTQKSSARTTLAKARETLVSKSRTPAEDRVLPLLDLQQEKIDREEQRDRLLAVARRWSQEPMERENAQALGAALVAFLEADILFTQQVVYCFRVLGRPASPADRVVPSTPREEVADE